MKGLKKQVNNINFCFWVVVTLLLFNLNAEGQISLKAGSISGVAGSSQVVPIKVYRPNNLRGIFTAQGTISYDTARLALDTIAQYGMPGMGFSNFNPTEKGKLTFSWNDITTGQCDSLPADSIIFSIRFNLKADTGQTFVRIDSSRTPIEFTGCLGTNPVPLVIIDNILSVVWIKGQIINPLLTAGTGFCNGSPFSVPFTASGIFNASNLFILQLSDSSGLFTTPIHLDSLFNDTNTIKHLNGIMPTIYPGRQYRMRIISTSPALVGPIIPIIINRVAIAPAPIASSQNICPGQRVVLRSSGIYDSILFYPGGTWQTGDSVVVNPLITSTYSCQVISNGCTSAPSTPVTVTVSAAVALAPTASSVNICAGEAVTIKATGFVKYLFSTPNSAWSVADSVSLIPTASAQYSFQGINAAGCTSAASAAITINVNPRPQKPVVTAQTSVCQNNVITLCINNQAINTIYTWSLYQNGVLLGATQNGLCFTRFIGTTGKTQLKVVAIDTTNRFCQSDTGYSNLFIVNKPNTIGIKSDTLSGQPGSDIEIPFKISGPDSLKSIGVFISWDTTIAKFDSTSLFFGNPNISRANFQTVPGAHGILSFVYSAGASNNYLLLPPKDSLGLFRLHFSLVGSWEKLTAISIGVQYAINQFGCLTPVNTEPGQISIKKLLSITGNVVSEDGKPIKSVSLDALGGYPVVNSLITDAQPTGAFTFPIPEGGKITIYARKVDEKKVNNGISTIDVALVRRHILGQERLKSPYKQIAADPNRDNVITTADISLIRELILAKRRFFPGSRHWVFTGPFAPTDTNPFPFYTEPDTTLSLTKIDSNTNVRLIGIRIGDVNNSWDNTRERRGLTGTLTLQPEDIMAEKNTITRVPIQVKGAKDVSGLQFSLQWEPSALQFLKFETELSGFAYNTDSLAKGKTAFTWDHPGGNSISKMDGETLLNAVFRVRGTSNSESKVFINSCLTQTEAFNQNMDILGVPEAFGKIKITNTKPKPNLEILDVVPNPASTETEIRFLLSEADENGTEIRAKVYNLASQAIYEKAGYFDAGLQTLVWYPDSNLPNGTYIVALQSPFCTRYKRICINR